LPSGNTIPPSSYLANILVGPPFEEKSMNYYLILILILF
jgi:hypothetical protein